MSADREGLRERVNRLLCELENCGFGAGVEEREGGSTRRQALAKACAERIKTEILALLDTGATRRASEPTEAETEVIDGVRGLFIHADAVPDVVMVNGVHFTPTESREGEERDASTCGASVFDYHGEAGECVLRDGHDGDCYAGPQAPGGTE